MKTDVDALRVRFEASLGNLGATERYADGRYVFEFVEAGWQRILARSGEVGVPGAEFASMATQAGLCNVIACPIQFFALLHFAGLVAAMEREACAQVCDGFDTGRRLTTDYKAAEIAAALRARGQKEGA